MNGHYFCVDHLVSLTSNFNLAGRFIAELARVTSDADSKKEQTAREEIVTGTTKSEPTRNDTQIKTD